MIKKITEQINKLTKEIKWKILLCNFTEWNKKNIPIS